MVGMETETVRRSERLKRKADLSFAIVPWVGEVSAPPMKRRRACGMHVVRQVYDVHMVDGSQHVHVVWEHPEQGDPEVIPISWLSPDLLEGLKI